MTRISPEAFFITVTVHVRVQLIECVLFRLTQSAVKIQLATQKLIFVFVISLVSVFVRLLHASPLRAPIESVVISRWNTTHELGFELGRSCSECTWFFEAHKTSRGAVLHNAVAERLIDHSVFYVSGSFHCTSFLRRGQFRDGGSERLLVFTETQNSEISPPARNKSLNSRTKFVLYLYYKNIINIKSQRLQYSKRQLKILYRAQKRMTVPKQSVLPNS